MSLIKTFVDAFKKASAPKDKSALEQVRDQAGLGVSADTDAFEPIPQPGGTPGGTANFIPNPQPPQYTEPIKRPPSEPSPPKDPGDQGPIDGGDGGGNTPTYPSAPFDPVTIKFPNTQAQGGGTPTPPSAPFEPPIDPGKLKFPNTQAQGGGLPDAADGGDKIAGLRRPPTGIKAEGVEPPLGSSDPEEGGEVSEAGKTDLDEGFIRRLRLVDDGSTVIEGGDTPESAEYSGETTRQGNLLVQVGGDGSEGEEGSGPHPPGPGNGTSEGERISFVDNRGTAEIPGASAGGDAFGRARPPFEVKGDNAGIADGPLQSSDPEEGGEVLGRLRSPAGFKVEDAKVTDPDGGDEVLSRLRPRPPVGQEIPAGPLGEQLTPIDEGGEVAARHIGNVKYEDIKVVDGPAGGDEITEIAKGKAQPEGFNFTHTYDKASPVLARESADPAGDPFKVEMEEVLVSPAAVPGGQPIPYPNEAPDEDGLGDSLARKAGEGQKDFLKVELKDAFISREASDGIDGESSTKDHKGEIELARRTGVKDAHDRPTGVDSPEPKPVNVLAADDDDDFESSSLLDLRAEPAAREMRPGLAGGLDDAKVEFDLDDDLDGADESEL